MTTTYTILTLHGRLTVAGAEWTRADGSLYVYPDTGDASPVAEVDAEEFVAIVDADAGEITFDR